MRRRSWPEGRERMNPMRGVTVNTSIVGHGSIRNGAVQGGAVALLLGAVLAASGAAHAAETPPTPNAAKAAQAEAEAARQEARAQADAARSEARSEARRQADAARQVEAEAAQREARAASDAARREAETARQLDERLQEAQRRLQEAAAEVAELSQVRAQDAMERMNWAGVWTNRAVLGIQLNADNEASKDGARIEDVSPGGPAEEAGVRAGDVIVMVDGKDVRKQTPREVLQQLRVVKAAKPVKLRVLRDGKTMDFDVTPRVIAMASAVPPVPPMPAVPPVVVAGPNVEFKQFGPYGFSYYMGARGELSGLEVTPVTPQLGRYFGTDKGMLVLRAPKGELFKLQEGDVIVSIDGREPSSGSHISRILSSYQPGEKLTVRILRDRKQQDLTVTLPEGAGAARSRDRNRSRDSSTDEL